MANIVHVAAAAMTYGRNSDTVKPSSSESISLLAAKSITYRIQKHTTMYSDVPNKRPSIIKD